jgi:hypothetical protein
MAQDTSAPLLRVVTGGVTGGGNADPVTQPLPALSATGNPEPATAPVTGARPDGAEGALPVPMTRRERTRLTLARRAGTAAEGAGQLWFHPGRLAHKLAHAAPDPTSAHWGYVTSGGGVPRELRGTRKGKAIRFFELAYHLFAIAADKSLQGLEVAVRKTRWAVQRPLRFLGFLVPAVVLLFIVGII